MKITLKQGSDDNGFVTNYWYDADGERTVKTSGESDASYRDRVFTLNSTGYPTFRSFDGRAGNGSMSELFSSLSYCFVL